MRTPSSVRTALAALICLADSGLASAATIYGAIFENGAPVANAALTLTCAADGTPRQTNTDARGTYRFTVSTTGRCEFIVRSGDVQATTPVILYNDPTPYAFDLVRDAHGVRLVRR
jgi:uncharacterized protein YfaS (alpha-2-macroglobulin family)